MAIARYCAKLAKLEGEGADWATSQMMMEESNDISNLYVAAKYRGEAPDTHANWEKVMKEENVADFLTNNFPLRGHDGHTALPPLLTSSRGIL